MFRYAGQWEFPPECFARIRCADTGRRKQFHKGLAQLIEEGVVRVLKDSRGTPSTSGKTPNHLRTAF